MGHRRQRQEANRRANRQCQNPCKTVSSSELFEQEARLASFLGVPNTQQENGVITTSRSDVEDGPKEREVAQENERNAHVDPLARHSALLMGSMIPVARKSFSGARENGNSADNVTEKLECDSVSAKEVMSDTETDRITSRGTSPPVSQTPSPEGSTIYHIYHSGYRTFNYSIHKIPDKFIPCYQIDNPDLPFYIDDQEVRDKIAKLENRPLHRLCRKLFPKTVDNDKVRQLRRQHIIENSKYDGRMNSSPYYLHNPYLSFHRPPYTLRLGGNKLAPTICVVDRSWFWREYRVILSTDFCKDRVIDPRGVLSPDYGTKRAKGELLKGYRVRKWRLWMESGKAYHKEVNEQRRIQKKLGTQTSQPSASSSSTASTLAKDNVDEKEQKPEKLQSGTKKLTVDKVVRMSWTSPIFNPRLYKFQYGGIYFSWKGTATVKDDKMLGFFLGINHLKLVATLPPGSTSTGSKSQEICVAKYTCVFGLRKAGRLEVFHQAFNVVLDQILGMQSVTRAAVGPDSHKGGKDDPDGRNAAHKEFNDVLMATALCMIHQECQKREVLEDLLYTILEAAQNAS